MNMLMVEEFVWMRVVYYKQGLILTITCIENQGSSNAWWYLLIVDLVMSCVVYIF